MHTIADGNADGGGFNAPKLKTLEALADGRPVDRIAVERALDALKEGGCSNRGALKVLVRLGWLTPKAVA